MAIDSTHCRMKVSFQLELTSGTSCIAMAAAFTMKSLTDNLYWPPAPSFRLLRTLGGREGGREGEAEREGGKGGREREREGGRGMNPG